MRRVSLFCISTFLCFPGLLLANNETNNTNTLNATKTTSYKKGVTKNTKPFKEEKTAPQTTTPDTTTNLKFSGYAEGSYNYLVRSNQFISDVDNRVYDLEPNGLTLQQLAMTFGYQPQQGFGGLLNLTGGRDATKIAQYGFNPTTLGFNITQAYLQYSFHQFTLFAGEMLAITGIEAIDPTQDAHFSRSILFGYAMPNTVTGLRGQYIFLDNLKLILGINDGWNNMADKSRRKTIEAGAFYTIIPTVTLGLSGYSGDERAIPNTSSGQSGTRNLIDLTANWAVNEKWNLAGNYDFGRQSKAYLLPTNTFGQAIWQGIAGYVGYKFNDDWKTAVRGEYFNDKNGYRTGVHQSWKELTWTLAYIPIKNAQIRAEIRHDFSNVTAFENSYGALASNNQQSFALEGIYQF